MKLMKLGLKPAIAPKTKTGDFERALQLVASFGAPEEVKQGIKELGDAAAAHDKARDDAQAVVKNAVERGSEAQASEANAIRARQALADETAKARTELGQRETAVAERERLAAECERSQEARDKELTRREDHLRKAGVRGF
jgi:hypothetical protein